MGCHLYSSHCNYVLYIVYTYLVCCTETDAYIHMYFMMLSEYMPVVVLAGGSKSLLLISYISHRFQLVCCTERLDADVRINSIPMPWTHCKCADLH